MSSKKEKRIRIKLAAYQSDILDKAANSIISTAERTGAPVKGPVPLPTNIEKITVLRGPHVNKKSREQFEIREHTRIVDVLNPNQITIEALMKLDLASGVDVQIKLNG